MLYRLMLLVTLAPMMFGCTVAAGVWFVFTGRGTPATWFEKTYLDAIFG